MLWTSVALLLMILPALIKSGRGPYSFFFRVVSQASIKAWWHTCPVTLWVAQTKVQNYIKEWWKNVHNLNISDSHFFLRLRQWLCSCITFFSVKGSKTSSKNVTSWSWCVWGTGSCFTCDKMLFKKCHILMRAVMFSTNGTWMQYFTKNWARDCFVENTALSCPNLRFHCGQKILVTLHYSKSFKWKQSEHKENV